MRAGLWLLATPILLFGSLLAFSRGAWINLAVSLVVYACFTFATVSTHRQRLKLVIYVVLAGMFAVGIFAAALTIPRSPSSWASARRLEQSYDVGPEGRFGGQQKAVGLVLTHPLGIGALEFAQEPITTRTCMRSISACSSTPAGSAARSISRVVLLTIGLGLRQVVRDRGGDGISAVLVAAFIGMALEGVVIDSDHWRHFYLIMAMIWGMALAQPSFRRRSRP